MEDAVDALEVERAVDEVETLDRQPAGVLLLQRRVVVVRERVPARRVVAPLEERAEQVRADEPGGAGDDVAHGPGMLGQRPQDRPVPSQADLGEEARHEDALLELAEARLGPLAAGERESELRVAAAGGQRSGNPPRSAC